MKSLSELIAPGGQLWEHITELVSGAAVPSAVLPSNASTDPVLEALQMTTGSTLGSIVHSSGGLLIDHGWVRLNGGGHEQVRAVADEGAGLLTVGHDVVGGQFALNVGALWGSPGEVNYWGPDVLEWTPLGLGYSDFVFSFLEGATVDFYSTLRWNGWEEEVAALPLDQGLALYPPPFSEEGQVIDLVERSAVDLKELHYMYADYEAEFNA